MGRGPSAKRYAQAAFQIAQARGQLDLWMDELRRAAEALSESTLLAYLGVRRVPVVEKVRTVRELLQSSDPLLQNMVCVLASRLSLQLLPGIVARYQELLDRHSGRERAEVVAAVPLDSSQRDGIKARLEGLLQREVVLSTRVDPGVVGGLVARVGDRVLDGSLRGRLDSMKRTLVEAGA